jgi:hypothetical protein
VKLLVSISTTALIMPDITAQTVTADMGTAIMDNGEIN